MQIKKKNSMTSGLELDTTRFVALPPTMQPRAPNITLYNLSRNHIVKKTSLIWNSYFTNLYTNVLCEARQTQTYSGS
jgi:hypothetical protein